MADTQYTELSLDSRPAASGGTSQPAVRPEEAVERKRTTKQVIAEWVPRLERILSEWQEALPPEAEGSWKRGAAYVRESYAGSLVRDAPDVQLRNVLSLLAQKRIFVAPDALFFEVESATDIATRAEFQRLFERALAGGFQAIGVFVNERLFRNLGQAIEIKRQFRLKGIQLVYLGKFEGDQRNPAAWQLEMMQDTSAELHARNTSFYVGTHLETITRAGRPVGRIPEVYREGERAPSFLGRRGSVLSWEIVEPLATVMRLGMKRFLAGASLSDLAAWSLTTELAGVTPKQRIMSKMWWYWTLTNPKFAGYQMPTTYMGFKPGVESAERPRRNYDSELVPCILPALWSAEDYRRVVDLCRSRYHGPKTRRSYQSYLLSGVAVDADCGHFMKVIQTTGSNGHYWMRCRERAAGGAHSPSRRCDIAAKQLDALVGAMRFDDDQLVAEIEEELQQISAARSDRIERFRPNPAIAAARQALVALGKVGMDDIRAELETRVRVLEAEDAARRDSLDEPVLDYRQALARLQEWAAVWSAADTAAKNQMLRDVGLTVKVGPRPNDPARKPQHIVEISADNPVFALALSTALWRLSSTLDEQKTWCQSNVMIRMPSTDAFAGPSRLLGTSPDSLGLFVVRPLIVEPRSPNNCPPKPSRGSWLTTVEFAERVGRSPHTVVCWVREGRVSASLVLKGKRRWWMIPSSEVARVLASRQAADSVLSSAA